MLPKVANTLLHSTSRAATAVHGQSHTIRNVLQLQHSSSSSQQNSQQSSQQSTSGSGPNGPTGKGPGSNFFNPNWHGSPGTKDSAARSGRFTHGYLGASRAVSQAQPFTSSSDGVAQFDEDQGEFEVVVHQKRSPSTQTPTRRFRSHSLSYSSKERAQKLGVLRTVQLHARSKHAFANSEKPDSVESSLIGFEHAERNERPVSPMRSVRSRSNSTATATAAESESLRDEKGLPPQTPLEALEKHSVSPRTSSPLPPQSASPASSQSASESSPSTPSTPSQPFSKWHSALVAARDSGNAEEAFKVVNAFRSAVALFLEAQSSATQNTSKPSLSSPLPRPRTPPTTESLPPVAHEPTLPELNLALQILFSTRKDGEPLTLMLKLYSDIIAIGKVKPDFKPNFRTYTTMIHALCDRETEIAWAFQSLGMRKKWRGLTGFSQEESIEEKEKRQLEFFKAENNFRSAMALFQALTVVSAAESNPIPIMIYSVLLRACSTRGVLANATLPVSPMSASPIPVYSQSQQESMITEAVTSAIHVWSHMEKSGVVPSAGMYRNLLYVFSRAGAGSGKDLSSRGWQGVKDVWEDFRKRCIDGGISWDLAADNQTPNKPPSATHLQAKRSIVLLWNTMIEASFRCGEPGMGVALLDDMMRNPAPSSPSSVTATGSGFEQTQGDTKASNDKDLVEFDPRETPLPTPATFTTIVAGFVGLALKAIHGVPPPDSISSSQDQSQSQSQSSSPSQLQAAQGALEEYKEHMSTALVWMDKLASMPAGPGANPLDDPSPDSSASTSVSEAKELIIARPDHIAWRTVIEALGEGYKWEMDWAERGLGSSSLTPLTSTYSLPALNNTYATFFRTSRAHPEDGVVVRRLDTRLAFRGNLRHIYALRGRLGWAVGKSEEIVNNKDRLESIQVTIQQARKDLYEALEKEENILKDIPCLGVILDGAFSKGKEKQAEEQLTAMDIEMVKRLWEAWIDLGSVKGSWEDSTQDLLLAAQKRGISLGLAFFNGFRSHQAQVPSDSGSSAREQSRQNYIRSLALGFSEDVCDKVYPLALGIKEALGMVEMSRARNSTDRRALRMCVGVGSGFADALGTEEGKEVLRTLSLKEWTRILEETAKLEGVPKELVQELLSSSVKDGQIRQLPDICTVIQTLQEYQPSFDPMLLNEKSKSDITYALCWGRSVEEAEKVLATLQTTDENKWLTMFREVLHEDVSGDHHGSSIWLNNANQSAMASHSGPLLGDTRAPDLVGLGGAEVTESLSDGLSITESGSGSGSGASIGQSTAPSSPVEIQQQMHMQQAQIVSQTSTSDQYQLPGEFFLNGQPIPSRLYVDRNHTRNIDHLLSRAVSARDPTVFANEVFDLFVQGVLNNRVPSPFSFARTLATLGRCKQLDRIQFIYRVAQGMLIQMEHDKKVQSDTWFIIEDGMIIAFAQAAEVDAAHVHRIRILEQGGTPSADAYGGLILHVKDTTDDTSNAMALYQEAVMRGVIPNQYLYNNIISKLAKARKADYALELFNQMKASGIHPSSITYGAVIGACARVGDVDSAEILFEEMLTMKNFRARVPPFNTMMQLYTTTKPNRERALHYYQLMRRYRVNPTEYTYKLLMEAYVLEPIDVAKMEIVFQELVSNPYLHVQGTHFATLINAYGCVAKDLNKAISVFDSIATHPRGPQMDALVFEAMTNVLIVHRRMDLVPEYMARMSGAGIHMTAYIMNLLIKGYAAAGDVEKARELFESLLDPPDGVAAINNHAPHDPSISMNVDPMAPVYREPSTWEAMVRAELGAGHRDRALSLLERLRTRQYPEAVFNRISGILVDHSQVFL